MKLFAFAFATFGWTTAALMVFASLIDPQLLNQVGWLLPIRVGAGLAVIAFAWLAVEVLQRMIAEMSVKSSFLIAPSIIFLVLVQAGISFIAWQSFSVALTSFSFGTSGLLAGTSAALAGIALLLPCTFGLRRV